MTQEELDLEIKENYKDVLRDLFVNGHSYARPYAIGGMYQSGMEQAIRISTPFQKGLKHWFEVCTELRKSMYIETTLDPVTKDFDGKDYTLVSSTTLNPLFKGKRVEIFSNDNLKLSIEITDL